MYHIIRKYLDTKAKLEFWPESDLFLILKIKKTKI